MEISLNMIKQFEYTDILGWSVSRFDKFRLCKRQYYYEYYGKYDREYPRAKITALKQMTSIPLEIGNIVHDSIKILLERLLKSEAPIQRERFIDYCRKKTEENCRSKLFAEVYYKEIETVRPDALFDVVERSLTNFLDSERWSWIMDRAIYNKKEWIIEPPGYGETRIDRMKAYCKVDFLFPADGAVHVLDWKTGKQDEQKHAKQLLGYSTWVSYHFNKKPEEIFPLAAYLQPRYSEMHLRFSTDDFERFIQQVRSESEAMYAFCQDKDKNIPNNKDTFTQITNRTLCRFCNYRELCRY